MLTALAALLLAVAPEPLAEKYLVSGKLAEGEKALSAAVAEHPDDDQARFGLGTIQFVRAVETAVQSFSKHGLLPDQFGGNVPFARLPIPTNPKPEPINYATLRKILTTWVDDLGKAESTLSGVKSPDVHLPLHLGKVRLDLNGDGKIGDDESLMTLFAPFNRQQQVRTELNGKKQEVPNFVVNFDHGDAIWLRGYCHLLMAMSETYLAHDGEKLFNHSAHLFFARAETPFPFLKANPDPDKFDFAKISDYVAFVHELRFPIKEPARMGSALKHMEQVIALSRETWKSYVAETDDDHEWIPNPKQHSVLPNGQVTDEMVKGWMQFLDEAESILQGKTLVPFWRDADGQGVNLRRMFTEPRDLDLVLLAQGTAAVPYLERGKVTDPEVWRRLQRIFRGEFIGFAIWFN